MNARILVALLFLPVIPAVSFAQEPAAPDFRISSDLVLLDVVATRRGTAAPEKLLTRDTFRVFDNGQPVSIATFDAGAAVRPIALWFVVQCRMEGWDAQGSGLFAGQAARLAPALASLPSSDAVAVAQATKVEAVSAVTEAKAA